jgi:hypothetical protein
MLGVGQQTPPPWVLVRLGEGAGRANGMLDAKKNAFESAVMARLRPCPPSLVTAQTRGPPPSSPPADPFQGLRAYEAMMCDANYLLKGLNAAIRPMVNESDAQLDTGRNQGQAGPLGGTRGQCDAQGTPHCKDLLAKCPSHHPTERPDSLQSALIVSRQRSCPNRPRKGCCAK